MTTVSEITGLIEQERPVWIEETLTWEDVATIQSDGCDSGAYMPAVSCHAARKTMDEHGNTVLNFLEESLGELPIQKSKNISWSGIAVFYLSYAVEIWVNQFDVNNIQGDDVEKSGCEE